MKLHLDRATLEWLASVDPDLRRRLDVEARRRAQWAAEDERIAEQQAARDARRARLAKVMAYQTAVYAEA